MEKKNNKKQMVKVPIEDLNFITACIDVFQALATNNRMYKAEADKAYEMLHKGNYDIVEEQLVF